MPSTFTRGDTLTNMPPKKKEQIATLKFIPMPRSWPGKISSEDLFQDFAKKVRLEHEIKNDYPLVTLRIRQVGVKNMHDFIITVPKNSKIYRIQTEISRIQHGDSVYPKDVIIFKRELDSPAERLQKKRDQQEVEETPTHSQDKLSIGIHNDLICNDETKTLLDYFPDIQRFKTPPGTTVNTVPIFLHELLKVSESKRFHKLYDFEDAAVQDVETIVVPGSEQKTHDYPVPSFTIFYDILPYATIDTYRNDFPPLNLKNQSWMFRPIITTDQAHLVTPQSQHTQTDVHSRLLRYSIEITKEKQTEVYTRKSKIHSLGLNKVKVSPPLTQSPSKWTNSIKRLGTMRNFVDVTKKATEKHVSVQNTFGLKLPEPTVNFAFALKPSKSKSFLSPNK